MWEINKRHLYRQKNCLEYHTKKCSYRLNGQAVRLSIWKSEFDPRWEYQTMR
ncbi:hypothetical protein HWB02_gp068 [Klebsiella phage KNP2]|uniref:hypothetical protein n=1 Tax=Klebsiella phage KNP2 TaxID=1871716 RepID=UPI0018AD4065|nr:hypothetical protein HWB02_gp068 [Klebsiella phage KNP2]